MKSRKFTKEGQEWELPDAFYRISVKLIVKNDKNDKDELLVLKDKTNDAWELLGGGIDHGETIEQTARREVQEELSVDITGLDLTPVVIEIGLHPHNYYACKIYYHAKLSSFDFVHEVKFESAFVNKEQFLKLYMLGDESPIQKHADQIWP